MKPEQPHDSSEVSPELEAAITQDINLYIEQISHHGSGRPNFKFVKRGDKRVVDYWIERISQRIENYNFSTTSLIFDYLSDLSDDQQRAGGYNGLMGPEGDVQELRFKLLQKLQSFKSPSLQATDEEGAVDPQAYISKFERLFTRGVGMAKSEVFRKSNRDNGYTEPSRNPYLSLSPDTRHELMQKFIEKTLKEIESIRQGQTSESQAVNWLQEIANAEPDIEWATYIPEKSYGVVISLPHECTISGTLNIQDDGSRTMKIDIFQVNEKLRSKGAGTGSGIGTRLLEALVRESKKYEVSTLFGHITSKSALATRAKVCGKKNLEFYNHHTGEKLNKAYDEIMSEKSNTEEENLDYDVAVDLTKVKLE